VLSNSESTSIFLREFYTTQISISHKKIEEYTVGAADSGFDLYCPSDVIIKPKEKILYDLCVAGKPYFPGGYYLYPRSSFGKTNLRLCNSVGIIDNQYRGTYKAWIENLGDSDFKIYDSPTSRCNNGYIVKSSCLNRVLENSKKISLLKIGLNEN
jgi:dUTPase